MMYTVDISIDQSGFPNPDVHPNKRRQKRSVVWDYFTIETVNADCIRASCNQCKKSFAYITGSKLAGTSHLKRHIALGICPVGRDNQKKDTASPIMLAPRADVSENGTKLPRRRHRASNGMERFYFSGNVCSHNLARMIIKHDYPLHMVEHWGFINFTQSLQPQFNVTSVTAVEEQIMGIYLMEKQKILDLLNEIPGRLNLAVDLWVSNQSQSLAYAVVTGHFIDHNWKLQRRILNVARLQFPDSDTALSYAIASCLDDWCFSDRLFTLTLDRSLTNDVTRENIRKLLSIRNSSILNGQLLVNSCYVRILRNLAQGAIGSVKKTIEKVRDSVKYVKTSNAREERFNNLKQQLQVPSMKDLMIDDLLKWDTTYQMLVAASELKQVFSCLDTSDPDYKLTLSMEDWDQIEAVSSYLKLFYQAANILTSSVYPTTNLIFHEICEIHHKLMHASECEYAFVSEFTRPLMEKLSRYLEDCSLVLAIAVVLDPRYKMKFVELTFSRIYGEDAGNWIRIVEEGLQELYLEYVVQPLPSPTFIGGNDSFMKTDTTEEDSLLSNGDGFLDFDIYVSDIVGVGGQHMESELHLYLEENLSPRIEAFDVLSWWKVNRTKYLTLSKLACDVMSIPLSTVSAESVFDAGEHWMDSYKSSLRDATLQALICAKDWLQHEEASGNLC